MDTTTPAITPETANHVLWHFGRGGYQPGSFTQKLLELIAAADLDNKAKLAQIFPEYVHCVLAMEYDPNGVTQLQAAAQPRCYRCQDTDGPFAARGGDILCEPCAAPQPLTDGGAQ